MMPDSPLSAPLCPICGGPNSCAVSAAGSFEVECWCQALRFPEPLLQAVPEAMTGQACICRNCVESHCGLAKTRAPR